MEVIGSFSGEGPGAYVRRFYIDASLTKGQVVCWSGAAVEGQVGDPTDVNNYSDSIGVLLSQDLTYSTVTGSGGVLGEVTADPLQRVLGRGSGGLASGAALVNSGGTDPSHIITITSTSATVLSSVNVGDADSIFQKVLLGIEGDESNRVGTIPGSTGITNTKFPATVIFFNAVVDSWV